MNWSPGGPLPSDATRHCSNCAQHFRLKSVAPLADGRWLCRACLRADPAVQRARSALLATLRSLFPNL